MNKAKRYLSLLLTFTMIIAALGGCGVAGDPQTSPPASGSSAPGGDGGNGDGTSTVANEGGYYTPYVGALFSLPYFIDHRVGLELAGKVYGFRTAVLGPSEYDMSGLSDALEQQISQEPSAIFVSAFEDTVAPAINKAADAGIPVFTIDMDSLDSKRDVFIGGDTFDYGRVHAQAMAEALNGQGDILLQYNIGQNSQDQRAAGFKQELADNFPGINIVQEIGSENDTARNADAFKAALQSNPGIVGIAGLDSTAAVSAATAVRELGRVGEIMIVGDSKDDATLKLVEDGEVYATVAIKTITENWYASMLVDGMIKDNVQISDDDAAAGVNALPTFIDIGTFIIRKDTAKYFYQPSDPFDYSGFQIQEPFKDDVYYCIGALLGLPYFLDHKMGFEAACEELGVTGKFIGPVDYDMTAEAQMIEEAISQNPKGILVMAFEDTLAPAINKAKAAGIPVITIDMDTIDSERDFFVGGDTVDYGRIHARTMAEAIGGEGEIILQYNAGQNSQDQRAYGFKDELQKYPGIKIVQEVGSENDTSRNADAFKAALQSNPNVVGIAGMDSTAAVSAATAVRELGLEGITIIGDSKDDATLKLVESGEVYATVAIKTRIEPYIAMKMLYLYHYTNLSVCQDDAAAGIDTFPTRVDIGTFVITKGTAKYYYMG